MTQKKLKIGSKPSKETLNKIAQASKKPIVYDEDSPEFTAAQIAQIKEKLLLAKQNEAMELVSLRVKHKTLVKAKSLGDGYTTILSKILDKALDDPEFIKAALE